MSKVLMIAEARGGSALPSFATVATLVTLLLGLLPALAPLAGLGMPVTDDGHLHLYRLVAQQENVLATGMPSRWLPDLAYGYGAPIFNYYAPLAYVPALAGSLLGLGYVGGLKLAFALPLVTSALAMFLLARPLFGLTAGLAAGLVYAYLPYQLIDVYIRGALAETAAFAWLPLICWSLVRLRASPSRRRAAVATLAIAGLVLTHNIVSLFSLPAVFALALVLGWLGRTEAADDRRSDAGRYALGAGVAFGLGVGLGAWYWLPAILEKDLVQVGQAVIAPERFLRYFLQSWPPFQLTFAYDYAGFGTEEWGETKLGIVQVGTLVAGALAATRARSIARALAVWAIGIAVAASLVQVRFAAPLFEIVLLASYIQFPWRLLTLVGLATAILAGALVRLAPARYGGRPLVAVLLVGLSAYAGMARLAPRETLVDDRFLVGGGALSSELADFGIATTWFGELLPTTVPHLGLGPLRRAVLYGDGLAPARVEPSDLRIEILAWTPVRVSLRSVGERPDRLLVHQFFYPGWTATIDGVATPIGPGGRLGALAIDVPAGTHDVELRFGWTGSRLAGVGVSGAALGGLIALAGLPVHRRRRAVGARVAAYLGLGCLGLGLLAGGPELAGTSGDAATRSDGDSARVMAGDVDERLALVSASLDGRHLAQDGSLGATLYWFSRGDQEMAYDMRLRVARADGVAHDAWWAHGPTCRAWDRGELIRTQTNVRLSDDYPAGPARVSMVVERRDERGGQPLSELDLGTINVPARRADAPGPRFERVPEENPLDILQLVSYDLCASTPFAGGWPGRAPFDGGIRPGGALDVRLDWDVRQLPTRDVVASLELRARRDGVASGPRAVGKWFLPFLSWQVGDRIGQQIRLSVPDGQAPGTYDPVLRLASRERPWVRLGPPTGRSGRDIDQGSIPLGEVVVRR